MVSVCLMRKCEKRIDFEMWGCLIFVGISRQSNSFVGGELSLVISYVIEPNKSVMLLCLLSSVTDSVSV